MGARTQIQDPKIQLSDPWLRVVEFSVSTQLFEAQGPGCRRYGLGFEIGGLRSQKIAAAKIPGTLVSELMTCWSQAHQPFTAIAAWLNDHQVPSREGAKWHPHSVARVMNRLATLRLMEAISGDPSSEQLEVAHPAGAE